jgi:hypothetical protein
MAVGENPTGRFVREPPLYKKPCGGTPVVA